ncbi:DUF2309 domain-containing protein [Paenibacillus elgii]|uniref:DUF2309 domain-containing protein n=1 Tax=Paenibacillus elgii TaxID=189691 RepID=UPI0013D170BA|nr:putative inorganic carbon transporter subunit DabA [Paenibacillus elgii]
MSESLTLLEQSEFEEAAVITEPFNQGLIPGAKPAVHDLVTSASRVIAPLGPISVFAARHPWAGMEEQSFDQVARWSKAVCDVDIYPNVSILREAKNRGEINPEYLETNFRLWLDSQSIDLPRDVVEKFCRAALRLDNLTTNVLEAPELTVLAKKLSHVTLHFFEEQPMQTLSFRVERQQGVNVASYLDHHVIKWCKLYLDESQAAWSMPNRKEGFFRAWRRLVQYDPALRPSQRKQLSKCPEEAHEALLEALSALEISQPLIQRYLEAHLLSLPGWAGMMLWRSQQSTEEKSLLLEYLAVRISMEQVFIKPYLPLTQQKSEIALRLVPLIAAWVHWGETSIEEWSRLSSSEQKARLTLAYRFDDILRRRIWLEAWEQTFEEQLKAKISSKPCVSKDVKSVMAQFAFCIDTRSEPFRRALEKEGPFATYGVAGFFGLPIETVELGSKHGHFSLPVILEPKCKVKELASEFESNRYLQRLQSVNSLKHTFQMMKQNLLTSLLLPEVSGPWLSLQMLGRSLFPREAGRVFKHIRQAWLRKPSTELSLDYDQSETELPVGFSEEEKVHYARQALKMMGLTDDFAPLVVICGHGSHSTNNPYASSLDCGACGGASGRFNARVLASLCNLPNVRNTLAHNGIVIPEETVFVAAEHITTINELRWLYVPKLSNAAQHAFDQICAALPKVTECVNKEQLSKLPNLAPHSGKATTEMRRFAEDWSELRPEWGLARNAAFIIGGRQLTKECNLDGRVFLHNYDWQKDHDGTLLANIIAGPATVAQWINLQYYASTVAPHHYGSGNKATQTVTAGIGVMQGNASDLLTGLPWQSVMKSDQEFYHPPLRLLILIEAPQEVVKRLLDHDHTFRQKLQNGWVRLANLDPKGYWKSWSLNM